MRVETSASADRQAALPKRESDPGRLTVPADTEVGRMVTLPLREQGEWGELEEIELWPEEDEGQ